MYHNLIKNSPKIGVFGSDGDHCTEKAKQIAYEVGKILAENKAIIFTGGGSGVMEFASKGASDFGGIVINILSGEKAEQGNKYSSITIPTGIGFARSQVLTNSVDGAILIEGGLGTHQEAAFMYWLRKPTVAIKSSGGTATNIAGKILDKRNLDPILSAENAQEAVKIILNKLIEISSYQIRNSI